MADFQIVFTVVALNACVLGVVFFAAFLFNDMLSGSGK